MIEDFPFSVDGFALGCAHEPEDVVERAIEYLRNNYARNVVERAELEISSVGQSSAGLRSSDVRRRP